MTELPATAVLLESLLCHNTNSTGPMAPVLVLQVPVLVSHVLVTVVQKSANTEFSNLLKKGGAKPQNRHYLYTEQLTLYSTCTGSL